MTSKLDTLIPVQYSKPVPPPLDLRGSLAEALKHLDKAIASAQNLDVVMELRQCLSHVEHAARLCGRRLPGFEDLENKPKRRFVAPTIDDVRAFCLRREVDIHIRDADWFWNKMDGAGWKNGGKPVVSWQGTLRSWKLAGYLPSQRAIVNAHGQVVAKTPTIVQRDLDRLDQQSRRL